MGVLNGQPVDQTYTNQAFMDKNADTFTIGKVSLQAPTAISGPTILDVQATINSFVSGASGVFTLQVSGHPVLTGGVTLAPSGAAVLGQVGSTILIYAPPSGAAVNSISASGSTALTGVTTLSPSGIIQMIQTGQNIQVYAPAPTATVTSVGFTGPGGIFSVSGQPVVGAGTIVQSASGTSGGIPYFSSSTILSSSTALAANQLILGGGVGVSPATLPAGSQYQVLAMGASIPAYGAVHLDQTAAVTGVLPTGNVSTGRTINAQTGTTYTFVLADGSAAGGNPLVTASNASAQTYTVPTNASVAFPVGTQIDLLQLGAGKVTLAAAGGVTITSQSSNLSIAAQYVAVSLIKTATNTWTLIGNLIA
jgi:hypothetical protein